ncbi:MAG: hypothetical protein VKL39_20890 [Leptolyngbyaceae bacterium]|nr:hypothetical protein [Leptolyngbyaceae bacterium]
MTPTSLQKHSELQAEVARLREELMMRDQLVQQLSQELFRMVKGVGSSPQSEPSETHQNEVRSLRQQLRSVETKVESYAEQIAKKDAEIAALKQSVAEMRDRTEMLQHVVHEMPRVYKEKFAERMVPIREKVARIQKENRQLHAELQSVSYRLAVRNRRIAQLDLPNFPKVAQSVVAVPSLSDV